MPKTQERFWTMCNVAKMNLGTNPMVLIDSFNDWAFDSCIEPTDPSYGKGYGLLYLDMVKDQFITLIRKKRLSQTIYLNKKRCFYVPLFIPLMQILFFGLNK